MSTVMTEAAAKTRWCPFLRVSGGGSLSVNSRDGTSTKCLGDGCMGWRGYGPDHPNGRGYCGLVGSGAA